MARKNDSGLTALKEHCNKGGESSKASGNNTYAADEAKPVAVAQQNACTEKNKKYLRLDITDYQDYISLMADHFSIRSGKHVSMTQYILKLIENDKQQHIELFEKLESIENMKKELI